MTGIDNYSEQFKINVGKTALNRQRVYLDTKYWVFMRDAALGKSTSVQLKIYELLKDLVAKQAVICPLSYHAFIELMNIGDEQKRLNTARVMDELSRQICFISPENIVGQELINFLRLCQAKAEGKKGFNPTKYVFTKVPFVMGDFYPTIEGISDEQMNDIRRQFFEHLSNFSLIELLNTAKERFPGVNRSDLVARLNQGKDDNQDWTTFHEVFLQEITGILDVVKDVIEEVWKFLYAQENGRTVTPEEVSQSNCVKLFSNIIYNAFAQKKIGKELPFFHVSASLHAYIRYNKGQRYNQNVLVDVSHAAWALPYCDMFFTEKPLRDWICGKLAMLDKIYETKVFYKEEDVLNALVSLN